MKNQEFSPVLSTNQNIYEITLAFNAISSNRFAFTEKRYTFDEVYILHLENHGSRGFNGGEEISLERLFYRTGCRSIAPKHVPAVKCFIKPRRVIVCSRSREIQNRFLHSFRRWKKKKREEKRKIVSRICWRADKIPRDPLDPQQIAFASGLGDGGGGFTFKTLFTARFTFLLFSFFSLFYFFGSNPLITTGISIPKLFKIPDSTDGNGFVR